MSVEEFLDALERSALIEYPHLKMLIDVAPSQATQAAPALAEWLVLEGVLTDFQAEKLLKGIWRGLVISHFEVRGFLGKGGMGSVYLCRDRRDMKLCALKILPVSKRAKTRNVLRFRREMELSQRLEHPGIAVAYESGSWQGVDFLAMEYVAGSTLYQLIRAHGPAPPYLVAKWLAQIADALDYVHQAGVVHRDLKPSNIIITPDGSAKLLDLGLARWYEDDHNEDRVLGEKRIVGSFDYISPEQASNSARADPRSDIYGMGCLMYFALAGRPPFHDVESNREKLIYHRKVQPVAIEQIRPDLPRGFARAVAKMMAKDPQKRFQVSAEVRDVLNRWEQELQTTLAPKEFPFRLPQSEPESPDEPVVLESDSESSEHVPIAGRPSLWTRLTRLLGLYDLKRP